MLSTLLGGVNAANTNPAANSNSWYIKGRHSTADDSHVWIDSVEADFASHLFVGGRTTSYALTEESSGSNTDSKMAVAYIIKTTGVTATGST